MTIYGRATRELACGLFAEGFGYGSASARPGMPGEAVRKWHLVCRAVGRGGLPGVGEARERYDFETKVAAARSG